jgi:NAD-dependent DNA ligase
MATDAEGDRLPTVDQEPVPATAAVEGPGPANSDVLAGKEICFAGAMESMTRAEVHTTVELLHG